MTTIQDVILHLQKKDPNTFESLLEKYLKTPNADLNQILRIQGKYVSPVIITVQKGYVEILKLLVNNGARLAYLGGFEDAIQSDSIETLHFLLIQHTDYNTTSFLQTAIIKAIQLHRLSMIALLLDFCFERYLMFDYNYYFLQTVFHAVNTRASNKQTCAIIEIFIDHGLHSISDLSLFSKKQRALIYTTFENKEKRLCYPQTGKEIIFAELEAHYQKINLLEKTRVLSTAAYLPVEMQKIIAEFLFVKPPLLLLSNPLNKTYSQTDNMPPAASNTLAKLKSYFKKI